jgi:hypothetical protein
MSNLNPIIQGRKAERHNTDQALRAVIAAEHTADSLEGIREDMGQIAHLLSKLVQSVDRLAATAPKSR